MKNQLAIGRSALIGGPALQYRAKQCDAKRHMSVSDSRKRHPTPRCSAPLTGNHLDRHPAWGAELVASPPIGTSMKGLPQMVFQKRDMSAFGLQSFSNALHARVSLFWNPGFPARTPQSPKCVRVRACVCPFLSSLWLNAAQVLSPPAQAVLQKSPPFGSRVRLKRHRAFSARLWLSPHLPKRLVRRHAVRDPEEDVYQLHLEPLAAGNIRHLAGGEAGVH